MSNFVYWVLETEVRDGKLDALKTLMKEMVDTTKADEPGTLNFEWTISGDNKRVTLFERYRDSSSAVTHVNAFMKNFAPRFMDCLEIKKQVVHGNASDELQKMLSGIGAKFMSPFGGFSR